MRHHCDAQSRAMRFWPHPPMAHFLSTGGTRPACTKVTDGGAGCTGRLVARITGGEEDGDREPGAHRMKLQCTPFLSMLLHYIYSAYIQINANITYHCNKTTLISIAVALARPKSYEQATGLAVATCGGERRGLSVRSFQHCDWYR